MNKSLLAAIAIASNRRNSLMGTRPSEEEIVAWAEGSLPAEDCARVKHWISHDPGTQSIYEDYMYYEDAPPLALDAAAASVSAGVDPVPSVQRGWYTTMLETLSSLLLPATGGRRVAGALVCLAIAGLLLLKLLPSTTPVGLTDYIQMANNPAENWQFQAALDNSIGSTLSTRDIAPELSFGKTAFLFGIRSSLQSMGISEHATVVVYYESLPKEYPLCESGANLCEQSNSWHYQLGQWFVLTERSCNTSLAADNRKSLLTSQETVLTRLIRTLMEQSLTVDESLQVHLLEDQRPTLCPLADKIYQWGTS